jgi:uncharacterized protein YuzE
MRIQYFEDTDTLYIEFRAEDVAETRDLDPQSPGSEIAAHEAL